MQAIILAAGMGKRLGELTSQNTKCMVKVNGKSLIDRALSQLSTLGLKRLVLVVGYEGQKLIDYIGKCYDDKLKIEYVFNPIYDKTNNIYSLYLAKEKLCEDDTLLLESDLIFEDGLLKTLVSHPDPNLALVAKHEAWMDGTVVLIDENRNIINFVSKKEFNYEKINTYYKTVNIYKFSQDFLNREYIPFIEAYIKTMGNNEYYEQVLRVLTTLNTFSLKALPLTDEKWYEIDDIQDLDIAETLFSDDKNRYEKYISRYSGFWRFPKLLDFYSLTNPFFPSKRMKDEIRASFDILLTEYPSGIKVTSMLAGKCFGVKSDYIIAGNGDDELIKASMKGIKDKKIGVIYPTFDEYPNRLNHEQIVPFMLATPDFSYTAEDIIRFFEDKDISLLFINNPGGLSGNYIPKNDILSLASWCEKKGIRLFVDESFSDFAEDFPGNSLLCNNILEKHPNLMVMKNLSQSYGVPGLRLGVFASSDTRLIEQMKKEESTQNINSFAEFFLQIYGKYEKDYIIAHEKFIEERKTFYNELQEIPFLSVISSQANYFLCKVTGKYTSKELAENLLTQDVIISDCGQNLIRLAIRNRQDNSCLIEILKSL